MNRLQLILAAIAVLLTSCEGGVSLEGYVYDKQTNQPLEKVQVILIFDDKDTVKKDRPINLKDVDITDSSKYKPSYTDLRGHFQVSSMLLGCVPKCPDASFLFVKEGYKPLLIKGGLDARDSVKLERRF